MTDKSATKPTDDPHAAGLHQDGKDQGATGDRASPENGKEKADRRLDEALEETFPSSDPVSVKVTK